MDFFLRNLIKGPFHKQKREKRFLKHIKTLFNGEEMNSFFLSFRFVFVVVITTKGYSSEGHAQAAWEGS